MASDQMTLEQFFSEIKHAEEQKQFVVLSPAQARDLLARFVATPEVVECYVEGK